MTGIKQEQIEALARDEKIIRSPIDCLYEIFHCNTKIRRYEVKWRKINLKEKEKSPFLELTRMDQKTYSTVSKIALPKVVLKTEHEKSIFKGYNIKRHSAKEITLDQLGELLYLSYGVIKELPNGKKLRPVLSTDNLYPIEIYPIIFKIRNIKEGIYHYNAKKHILETLKCGDIKDKLMSCCLNPELLTNAAVFLVLTAIFKRVTFKYGDRGYRYVLLDAGHVTEKLYLIAAFMDMEITIVREFLDDEINDLIGINGVDEATICGVAIRRRD